MRPIVNLMDSTGLSGAHFSTESAVYSQLDPHSQVVQGVFYPVRETNQQALASAAYVSGTQDATDVLTVEGRAAAGAPWATIATLSIGSGATLGALFTLMPQVRVKCSPALGAVYRLWIAE